MDTFFLLNGDAYISIEKMKHSKEERKKKKHEIWAWQKSFNSKIRERNEKKTKVDEVNEEIGGDKRWKIKKSFKFSILFLEFIFQKT